jgi:hypothetical protein
VAGSICAAQAAAFRRELRTADRVWTLIGDGQYIAPHKPDGTRAMPFWSRESRAQKVASRVPAYHGLDVHPIPLTYWFGDFVPWLGAEGILLGINWSGERAVGYDVTASTMAAWFPPDVATTPPGPSGSPATQAVVRSAEVR